MKNKLSHFLMFVFIFIIVFQNFAMGNSVISIYFDRRDNMTRNAISRFKMKNPDIEIEEIIVDQFNDRENLRTKLLSGEAADIIVISAVEDELIELSKNAVFYDLNEILELSNEEKTQLNKKVFDAGKIFGRRYFVPLSYSLPLFISTQEIIDEHNFTINNYTMRDFLEMGNYYLSQNSQNKKKFIGDINKSTLQIISGLYSIVFERGQMLLSEEELVEVLHLYKEFNEKNLVGTEGPQRYNTNILVKEMALMISLPFHSQSPRNIEYYYSDIKMKNNHHMKFIPMPINNYTDGYVAIVSELLAVSITAGNTKEIGEFIKLILSEDFQIDNSFEISSLSVNNNALNHDIQKYLARNADPAFYELIEDLNFVKNNIVDVTYFDLNIRDILKKPLNQFIFDKISAEECARTINYKIQSYLMDY